jgi:hypothetical protein
MLDPATLLTMQQGVGNALLARKITQTTEGEPEHDPYAEPYKSWNEAEVRAIQTHLVRLRLYDRGVDGDLGPFTDQGLVEAFGGDSWREMEAAEAEAALEDAKPAAGGGGGKTMRFGELLKDGVLDVTLGIGYAEEAGGTYPGILLEEMVKLMDAKGYTEDAGLAADIFAEAGRDIGDGAFGRFFVKENAFTYAPPAGEARPIHVILRMIVTADASQGPEALAAFEDSMVEGDASMYSGHGRYGSGPDFDRNFKKFTLLNADGSVDQEPTSYKILEGILAKQGDPWTVFLEREKAGTLKVELSSGGNLYFNPKNAHAGEFGAKLMYWALEKSGAQVATGEEGTLGEAAKQSDRKYRVIVFDGCRTTDYDKSLRTTPGFDSKGADMIETNRETGFLGEAETFMAFVDGIIAQQSFANTLKGMNKAMRENESNYRGDPYVATGLGDNPNR